MKSNSYIDNRNLADVTKYQEERIEALKRRIQELEAENQEYARVLTEGFRALL